VLRQPRLPSGSTLGDDEVDLEQIFRHDRVYLCLCDVLSMMLKGLVCKFIYVLVVTRCVSVLYY
jgi:hypothetical protein